MKILLFLASLVFLNFARRRPIKTKTSQFFKKLQDYHLVHFDVLHSHSLFGHFENGYYPVSGSVKFNAFGDVTFSLIVFFRVKKFFLLKNFLLRSFISNLKNITNYLPKTLLSTTEMQPIKLNLILITCKKTVFTMERNKKTFFK